MLEEEPGLGLKMPQHTLNKFISIPYTRKTLWDNGKAEHYAGEVTGSIPMEANLFTKILTNHQVPCGKILLGQHTFVQTRVPSGLDRTIEWVETSSVRTCHMLSSHWFIHMPCHHVCTIQIPYVTLSVVPRGTSFANFAC